MRQAPQLSENVRKAVVHPIILFLFAASVLAVGATLYLTRAQPEPYLPTMQEVVVTKTDSAAENQRFSLVVEENGPGYNLRFNGQVDQGRIYGKIDAYDLEVYSEEETYFVKGSGVFEEWEEMGKAELDALASVVRDPLALLQNLLSGTEILVEEGPVRMVEDTPCQTYFIEVPPPDIQMLTRFEEDATLNQLQLYLWFDEEEGFMHRMALLMNITVKEEAIQINRIYSLNPQTKTMPDGLPRVNNGFITI